jgi:predicted kinase
MATIHLVEGPVGAGKSTYAARLSWTVGAPHLDLDAWMVTLFSPDRPAEGFLPWYTERKARCLAQLWEVTCSLLDHGIDPILELGLVRRADREDFYRRVDAIDCALKIHLITTPLEERRRRVRERNRQKSGSFKMEVSDEVFALANGFWEEPDEEELRARGIEVLHGA